MVSFTHKTVAIILALAVANLLSLWYFPWELLIPVFAMVPIYILMGIVKTKPCFEISRDIAGQLEVGHPSTIRLKIKNNCPKSLVIEVEDCTPETMSPESARFSGIAPASGEVVFEYQVIPMRRGIARFQTTSIRYETARGLARRRVGLLSDDPVRVFPDLSDFRKFSLFIQSPAFDPAGMRLVKTMSEGTNFESLRDYRRGDEFNRVDWKATARKSKLTSRNYETEKNQNIMILIDTGRTMASTVNDMTKLDYTLRTVVALSMVCVSKGDNVGFLGFDSQVRLYMPPANKGGRWSERLDCLFDIEQSDNDTDYANAFDFFLSKRFRRSLVVVFTDFVDLDSSAALVTYMSAMRRHERICVSLSDSAIEDIATMEICSEYDFFRKSIAVTLMENRKRVIARLKGCGVSVIQERPERISVATIRHYLRLKSSSYI